MSTENEKYVDPELRQAGHVKHDSGSFGAHIKKAAEYYSVSLQKLKEQGYVGINRADYLAHVGSLWIAAFEQMGDYILKWAHGKGWNAEEANMGELIALMHSELSEALEGDRHGNPPSDKIGEFSAVEEEFADVIIRILHVSKARNLRVGEALVAKMAYNELRPHMHGGKKY